MSKLEITLAVLAGILAVAALFLIGFQFIESSSPFAASPPLTESKILFVTPTPPREDQIYLSEGQRSRMEITRKKPGEATPAPTPVPYFAGANEMGKIMVLEYHRIAYPETRYQRTPDNFRADLQRLYDNGFYPVNFVDVVNRLKDVPPGKKPVVITLDDSDISQFTVLADRTIDADSAVGIILNFHEKYKEEWPPRATFFVLGDDSNNHSKIFGQPRWAKQKLQVLVDLGMEIGSHTVNHVDLSQINAERIEWELAVSQHVIEELVPDYEVKTLSVPYGGFPWTTDFFVAGYWEDYGYTYTGNAAAWGGPTVSPFDPGFDPYHVSRIEVSDIWADHWFTYFEQNPGEYYVSDGDPGRLTYPQPTTEPEQELAADD